MKRKSSYKSKSSRASNSTVKEEAEEPFINISTISNNDSTKSKKY